MVKDSNRSLATIDGYIWLFCGRLGNLSAYTISCAPCYEYNFKGFVVGLIVGIFMLSLNVRCSTLFATAIFSLKPNPI